MAILQFQYDHKQPIAYWRMRENRTSGTVWGRRVTGLLTTTGPWDFSTSCKLIGIGPFYYEPSSWGATSRITHKITAQPNQQRNVINCVRSYL